MAAPAAALPEELDAAHRDYSVPAEVGVGCSVVKIDADFKAVVS